VGAPLARRISHRLTELPLTRQMIVALRHRGISGNDVFLASYPKSGNTWMKFMLAQLLSGRPVDFDSVERIVPDAGAHADAPRFLPGGGRLIKTHEPYRPSLARHYKRVVYIVRDGRDVAVSYYFSMLRTGLFEGSFEAFLDRFLAGTVGGFGAWHEHVTSWLGGRGDTLVLRYEDMLEDASRGLAQAARHLGVSPSEEDLAEVVRSNDAETMRSKESGTRIGRERVRSDINFVRSASSGEWRERFSEAGLRRFEDVAGDALRACGYAPEGSGA
jgi:hypothetical protein